MASGGSRVLSFGVSDETAWEVGLACGGKIEVLVEAIVPERGDGGRGVARPVLEELLAARRARRPVVLATPPAGGVHRLLPVPQPGSAGPAPAGDWVGRAPA